MNFSKPNEIILSVTNKCEIDLNVAFLSFDNEDNKVFMNNLSEFRPTASVSFGDNEDQPISIDRQDNTKWELIYQCDHHQNERSLFQFTLIKIFLLRSQTAAFKPTDLATNGFVCFRRDNKIGICCRVTPLADKIDNEQAVPHVRIVFGLRHCLDQKAISDSSMSSNSSLPSQRTTTIMQKVFIDFGPLKYEDGLKVIHKPKYISQMPLTN